jgi:hypothetical protein
MVPGVVRDTDAADSRAGPRVHGPPYATAFPPRVRRYLGEVLRSLQVDVVYWEDAVAWPDLRRALGVAFEMHDQGRVPLTEKAFFGLPRVRVVLQEEDAEAEPPERTPPTRAAGHARMLLVLKDRGGADEPAATDPIGSRTRIPSLV